MEHVAPQKNTTNRSQVGAASRQREVHRLTEYPRLAKNREAFLFFKLVSVISTIVEITDIPDS